MYDLKAYAKMMFDELMDEILTSDYDADLVMEQIQKFILSSGLVW